VVRCGALAAQLHHLAADPHELVNRHGDPALAEVQHALELELCDHFLRVQADLPVIDELWA